MTKRLIVPLDQSEAAESVLPLARGLAAQLDLPVTLMSVIETPPAVAEQVLAGGRQPAAVNASTTDGPRGPFGRWTGWTTGMPPEEEIERARKAATDANTYLKGIAEGFGDVPVEVTVRFGHPAEMILQTAEERPGSVITIASHGRGGIGQRVLGSVVSQVVRGATVPVFAVRSSSEALRDEQEVTIRKALVALDASAFAEQSLPVLKDIFGPDALDIHLVNVIEEPFTSPRENQEYLHWILEKVSTPSIAVTCETSEGTPPEAITRIASDCDADLIVLTTHGYSGIRRFLLGSVAERVLHIADRPLLLVHPAS